MKIENLLLSILLVLAFCATSYADYGSSRHLENPYSPSYTVANTVQDTFILGDRYGDFINNGSNNPFDLKDPSVIEKEVEFDPATGNYIITEKIGEDFYRMPTYMTFEEYLEWRAKKEEQDYFNKLAGVSSADKGIGNKVDPIAKFDIKNSLMDRLFCGTTVDIRPQGNINLTFGVDYQKVENPILTVRQQRQGGFDFDMDIQMNATGKIGEKLNLAFNYNTQATFDFENQMKLQYDSEACNEDEIIKKIEAGNVSLPLPSSLIQGSQSLFGIKTELQFGKLKLTAVASQQKSRKEEIQIQGGSQVQDFELQADQYDENRHFFLSHYNRNTFEAALENIPQINSLFKIKRIEVWVTNDRNDTEDVRDIVALTDLGECDRLTSSNVNCNSPVLDIYNRNRLPTNETNDLWANLNARPDARKLDRAVATLQSIPFNFQQTRDFEKVQARLLSPSEYNLNADLGFISINISLRPDQILGVAYEYTYNGENYKVGELTNEAPTNGEDLKVIYVKMLKSSTQRVDVPAWDLMMKNIYSVGAYQADRQDFKLDIFYEDPGGGQKRFLPQTNLAGTPLLRVFNLDNLNSQNDPQPDGQFDFVPGLTINTQNGRVMFPVLEPFGSSLRKQISNQVLATQFVYDTLYSSTVTIAREFQELNRYTIRGSFKSAVSNEISLGAFNLPKGSVRVTAGAQQLVEGQDYEVDYNIGRVKILNDALLNSGVPVKVSFEDNTLFGFQTKTMVGVRADYAMNKNLNIGGTYLHLFERPFTQKVNIGEDPINNRIYGLDVNYSKEAPWLTKLVDKIPLIQTKEPSSVTFQAEVAALQPGHSSAINSEDDDGGINYIDDFEGSASRIDLRTPANAWVLASVPQDDGSGNNAKFPESNLIDNINSGVNRARLNWYRADQTVRSQTDEGNPYTAAIPQREVFPNLVLSPTQSTIIQAFDVNYYPRERGPYNFDRPGGTDFSAGLNATTGQLTSPETRWGGIMRALNTNDFQAANIEYLECWVMSPYLDRPIEGPASSPGNLYVNLGNISEDILRDSRKFFENGLPSTTSSSRTDTTSWGRIPVIPAVTNAFDNDRREAQDVGLDGLDNAGERVVFADWLSTVSGIPNIGDDPANDDFVYYRDDSFDSDAGIFERYKFFNNPQGNSQSPQSGQVSSSTNLPDTEDLNQDNTLNESESYYQYKIPFEPDGSGGMKFNRFVTDSISSGTGNNKRIWYRVKIPLDQFDSRVGGIQDFRSIRFIRMYMSDFDEHVTMRFARLELVRNQWRRYQRPLPLPGPQIQTPNENTVFDVNAVNIEENSSKIPFGYVLPPGIEREQSNNSAFPDLLQNEQSLSMEVCNLDDGDARAIYKIINLDMRVFERLQMFVHAEAQDQFGQGPIDLDYGDMTLFMRIGSDFEKNYYEYEVPLSVSLNQDASNTEEYREEVWRAANQIDINFDRFREIKNARNKAGAALNETYPNRDDSSPKDRKYLSVKGNPNLGYVKGIMIGVRNRSGNNSKLCGEVWVNELRVNGLDERGGLAGLARLDMKMADFGSVSVLGNYSSIGWGGLEQKLAQRSREEVIEYGVSANFELGKFFPEKSGIKIPFSAQYASTIRSPEFDPYDLDIPLKEKLANEADQTKRDSIRQQAQDVTRTKEINFTNVRKIRTNQDLKPKPWNIENFSFTYVYTQNFNRNPIIKSDKKDSYFGAIDYNYSIKPKYITPFKKLIKKDKYLKLFSEFNFNPIPNSFNFSTDMDRQFQETTYRFAGDDPQFNTFYNKYFLWNRDYGLKWDLTKALKFTFNATNQAVIDEREEFGVNPETQTFYSEQDKKDFVWDNIKNFGRTKNYNHSFNVDYTLPFKLIPFMDWVQVKAKYRGSYQWAAAAINVDTLGNVITNTQNRQLNGEINMETLYNKSSYLKKISKGRKKKKKKGKSKVNRKSGKDAPIDPKDKKGKKKKKKKDREPSAAERMLIRPLLMVRKISLTYSEDFMTVIPGFTPETRILGMNDGFIAPGAGFVAGIQPDDAWFDRAIDKANNYQDSWITDNIFLNQEVIQNYTRSINGKIKIEPFKDFKIDLDADYKFVENHTESLKRKNLDTVLARLPNTFRDVGSFSISYFAMNTLFERDIFQLFDKFAENTEIISQRLGAQAGNTSPHEIDGPAYTEGYGRTHQEVTIPAFLATYTGDDPNSFGLNVFKLLPKLNWRLTYGGLSKLPWFKDRVQSVNLTHGYRSRLTVNQYASDLGFEEDANGNPIALTDNTRNYYSRYDIPAVVIDEQFSPLIGVDVRLKNDMSFRLDFKKARNLAFSATDYNLNETKTTEYIFGFGYRMKNVEIGFLKGKRKKKKKKKKDKGSNKAGGNKGGAQKGSDLNFKLDFSYRDDITVLHELDTEDVEAFPTRGLQTIRISPSVDYDVNKRLNVRLFFDYSKTNPKTSAQFPITNTQGGLTIRFSLN